MHMKLEKFIDDLLERQRAAELSGKVTNDYVENLVIQNCEQAKEIWQKETMIDEYTEEIDILKEEVSSWRGAFTEKERLWSEQMDENWELINTLEQKEEQIGELVKRLDWADSNLRDKMEKVNKYRDLTDDLLKVVSILIGRVEGNE